jgi:hypothetical protein
VKNTTFPHGIYGADWLRQERGSRPARAKAGTTIPLNAALGWSVALVVSLGLWWGIWLAVSSLASVLQ